MRAGRMATSFPFPSPWVIDILGKLDFDFVCIDFAQSLGYPGQPDHPEVIKAMQDITRRIHQAGRTMQQDVMQGAWISDMLLDAGRRSLSP